MGQIKKFNPNQNFPALEDHKHNEIKYYGREIILKPNEELTPKELELLEAINYKRINEFERQELKNMVYTVIEVNLRALQSKMKKDDKKIMVFDFMEELINYFPGITIKEFEVIIRNGIRKKFDNEKIQTVGLSVVNFNFWAKRYLELKAALNLNIDKKLAPKRALPEFTTKISEETILAVIENDFYYEKKRWEAEAEETRMTLNEFYIKYGLAVSSNYVYRELIKLKLVNLDEFKAEIDQLKKKKYQPKVRKRGGNFKRMNDTGYNSLEDEAKRIYCCKYYLSKKNKTL